MKQDLSSCGSEIKSVRSGKVSIMTLMELKKRRNIFNQFHIPVYKEVSFTNHNPYAEKNYY